MIIVVGGISNYSPWKETLNGTPHHVCDLLHSHLEKGHDINKELVGSTVDKWGTLVLAKSYGAWAAGEAKWMRDVPVILVGLPLLEENKKVAPQLTHRVQLCIWGDHDTYIDERTRNYPAFFLPGDHSLRPITRSKIRTIQKKLMEVLHGQEEKPEQGTRPYLHGVMPFSPFLSSFFTLRARAQVSIAKQSEYLVLDKVPRRFQQFVGEGLPVTHICRRNNVPGPYTVFQTAIADTSKMNGLYRSSAASGGLGIGSSKDAVDQAVYESLERYSLTLGMIDEVERKYDEIPIEFQIPSEELCFEKSNALRQKMRWTVIHEYGGKDVLYPSHLINPSPGSGPVLRETTSTGTALDTDINEAIRKGLLEAVERNSLVSWFYRRKGVLAKKCSPDEFSPGVTKLVLSQSLRGFKFHFYVIEYKGLQTVFAIMSKGKYFGIGSAAGPAAKSCEKAIKECLITYAFAQTLRDITPQRSRDIKLLPQHYLYYQGKIDILIKYLDSISKNLFQLQNEPVMLNSVITSLQGNKIFYKDVSAPELRAAGLVTVKVIVTGFLDVIKNHNRPWKEYHAYAECNPPMLPLPFA